MHIENRLLDEGTTREARHQLFAMAYILSKISNQQGLSELIWQPGPKGYGCQRSRAAK
jgi:hypothetical protein